VSGPAERPSARRAELLDRAYAYALQHGLADVSLRPLAAAIGSSVGVLSFLFGSKDALVRELLVRARADELDLLENVRTAQEDDPAIVVRVLWQWLSAPAHRPLLALWTQAYVRSLTEPDGPWSGFARATVEDWLALLAEPAPEALTPDAAEALTPDPTLTLAVLRGAMLDLLATGDIQRTTRAVERYLRTLPPS
jgi:AcrR family transcriptional regulator